MLVRELMTGHPLTATECDDFATFVSVQLPRLQKFGTALTGDEQRGADLVQDALECTYLRWSRVTDPGSYVRRAMVNRNISAWRKLSRESPLTVLPERATSDRSHDPDLFAAVRRLPPRRRAVIVLRYYEDLTEAQTAEVLGCSVGTVKSQASRAIADLRSLLLAQAGQ